MNDQSAQTDIDEPIDIAEYDPRWPSWYAHDAAELTRALGGRLFGLEHFGSTAVVGLSAKPVIDILLAPVAWPLTLDDHSALKKLGYEYFGEAGIPGREYFRRRAEHATNLAVVQWAGPLWNDNLAIRDYLRSHHDVASRYAESKRVAWEGGAQTLLEYSRSKQGFVSELLAQARSWRNG
jgi:GrpB-like predicted nucleotidyltransferase (UPF0157 family)